VENKSRRLTERLAATEAEKEDLRRQLAEERKDANRACAEAQAAQAEAKLARAEASLARQRDEKMETRLCGLRDRSSTGRMQALRGLRPVGRRLRA
jgi:vacuolar-type H+-ATPase subunit D/Vma8